MNLNDTCMGLTHRGLVTPFGDIDRCQHLLRQWLDAWQHQGIVWTNADYHLWSSSGTHLREILQRVVKLLFCVISLKYILLKLPPLLSGANESICIEGKTQQLEYDLLLICYETHWLIQVSVNKKMAWHRTSASHYLWLVCDLNRTPNCYGKTWRFLCPFFRNLHLRENLARDCFTSTVSTVTDSVQNIFTHLRYCDK